MYRDFENILQFSIDDPINHIEGPAKKTFGNLVKEMAMVAVSVDEEKLCTVGKVLVNDLLNIIVKGNILDNKFLTCMWSKVHTYTLAPNIPLWRTVLMNDGVSSEQFNSLHHTICMKVVESILKIENEKNVKKPEEKEFKITEEEQKVVRYVAGYITFSLILRYKRLKDSPVTVTRETADAAIEFLKSLDTKFEKDINARSFLQYTNEWVAAKNCGCLVKVNDGMFIFVRRVEFVEFVRSILNIQFLKSYHGEDLREVIYSKIANSPLIDSGWSIVARNLGNESLKNMLKKQILR